MAKTAREIYKELAKIYPSEIEVINHIIENDKDYSLDEVKDAYERLAVLSLKK